MKKQKVTAKELDLAMRLVKDMEEDDWKPEKYKDTYHDDLLARVREKVKAGETEELTEPEKTPRERAGAEVVDLMALLRKSVEKKPQRHPQRHHRARKRAA